MGRDALGAGKGWWGEGSVLQPPGHSELPSIQGNLKILPSPAADHYVTLSKFFPSLSPSFLIRKAGRPSPCLPASPVFPVPFWPPSHALPPCRELCQGSFYVSFSWSCHRPWQGSGLA